MVLRVVAVEGIHGVGKSTFLSHLRQSGETVLDEQFMDGIMNDFSPTGMARQTVWISEWIQRVVKADNGDKHTVYVDRSMYSTVMYNTDPTETACMKTLIDKIMAELAECGIHVKTVLFMDPNRRAWERIQARLKKEPERKKFNEHDIEHYNTVWENYYKKYESIWDGKMLAPIRYQNMEKAVVVFDDVVQKIYN